jgi:hypothetical protein
MLLQISFFSGALKVSGFRAAGYYTSESNAGFKLRWGRIDIKNIAQIRQKEKVVNRKS